MSKRRVEIVVVGCFAFASWFGALCRADGPKDNNVAEVRPIPPVAKPIDPAEQESIDKGLAELHAAVEHLHETLKSKPELLAYLPDVRIYENAVYYATHYHETLDPKDAHKAIADGLERAKLLADGKTPWTAVSGPRGYVSKIDGSVQPYRLVIPSTYHPGPVQDNATSYRLDFWGHGRDEYLTELRFVVREDPLPDLSYLPGHTTQPPHDKFVLALYGRYINAFKFAGEIDGIEALAVVKKMYPIDDHRILDTGFSMGGAGAWNFAVHYTDLFAAASPGAGFSETADFLKKFQKEDVSDAPWYEQTLWRLYDCTGWVANLANLPTIAYAGEIDPQKQASDVMLKAATEEGVKLDRLVGPGTGHRYEPATKVELDKRIDAILAKGRDPVPAKLRFTTYSLRYNHMYWLTVDGLEHHWRKAEVEGELVRNADKQLTGVTLTTRNVTALTISIPPIAKASPDASAATISVSLDGMSVPATRQADGSCRIRVVRDQQGHWKPSAAEDVAALHKRHDLQGPIDDAFMDSFLIVRPTGKPWNEKTGAWEVAECDHAIDHWRKQFRGEARVKNDADVTDADIEACNLVLFGDPSSNKLLARIADRLPIQWTRETIKLGSREFGSGDHVPVLIYPNPLHPARYIVLNSGFTYREYDYLNNARQTPKLPDYAVMDVNVARTSRSPAGVAAAGFFGENWELLADDGKLSVQWPPIPHAAP